MNWLLIDNEIRTQYSSGLPESESEQNGLPLQIARVMNPLLQPCRRWLSNIHDTVFQSSSWFCDGRDARGITKGSTVFDFLVKLNFHRKGKQRLPARNPSPLATTQALNQSWYVDFMHDAMASGRRYTTHSLHYSYSHDAVNFHINTVKNHAETEALVSMDLWYSEDKGPF